MGGEGGGVAVGGVGRVQAGEGAEKRLAGSVRGYQGKMVKGGAKEAGEGKKTRKEGSRGRKMTKE